MKLAKVFIVMFLVLGFSGFAVAENLKSLSDQDYSALLNDAERLYNQGQELTDLQTEILIREGIIIRTLSELDEFGGPDAGYYHYIDSDEDAGPMYDWIDISETGTAITDMGDDDYQGPFALPFTFNFYGNDWDEIWIGSNGLLSFGEGYDWFPSDLPEDDYYNSINFYAQDMDPEEGGTIYYGEDEDGNFVVSYDGIYEYSDPNIVTCQTILYPNGDILMQYHSFSDMNYTDELIGIQNDDGTIGLAASVDVDPVDYPYEELAILFYNEPPDPSYLGAVHDGMGGVTLNWIGITENLLIDDFTDGVADDFLFDPDAGVWEVSDNMLVGDRAGTDDWMGAKYDGDIFGDGIYEWEVSRAEGSETSSIGLIIRGDEFANDATSGYLFNITPGGSYSIFRFDPDGAAVIQAWTASPDINTGLGSWNTVTVVADGSDFTFYINDIETFAFTDDTYADGAVIYGSYSSLDLTDRLEINQVSIADEIEMLAQFGNPNPNPVQAQPVEMSELCSSPLPVIENPRVRYDRIVNNRSCSIYERFGRNDNEIDEFIEYVVYRDGAEIGRTTETTYDDVLPDYGEYEYYVTADWDEGESNPTNTVMVDYADPNVDLLIYNPDPTPDSGENVMEILGDLGYTYIEANSLADYELSDYQGVFVCTGMYPNFYAIETGSEDETLLVEYLDNGGNVYHEGGDTFGWVVPENLMPYFRLADVADGGSDLASVEGVDGTITEGMDMTYGGENSWVDDYTAEDDATVVFINPADDFAAGVIYWDLEGLLYKTATFSFEVGNLVDGEEGNTREDFFENFMNWFLVPPEFGTLEGTVVECEEGGEPIEGVEVYLNDELMATTDIDGMYSIPDIPVITYDIRFELENYYAETYGAFDLIPEDVVTLDVIMTYPEGSAITDPIIIDIKFGGEIDSTASVNIDFENIGCADLNWNAALNVLEVPWEDPIQDWLFIDGPVAGTLAPEAMITLTISADITEAWVGDPPAVQDGDVAFAELLFTGEPWAGLMPIDVVVQFIEETGVEEVVDMPTKYALHQNYPNPFNPTTHIRYDLVEAQDVLLTVYNLMGQQVAVLVNENVSPGYHNVEFDASLLGSGIYFYQVRADKFTDMKKMILVK